MFLTADDTTPATPLSSFEVEKTVSVTILQLADTQSGKQYSRQYD